MLTEFTEDPIIRERFRDLVPPLTPQAAVVESNRCLNCFDAPCMGACPTHIDVPEFIKRIASGNLRGSAHRILEANVLAGSCSRVCPVEVLCEGACVMHRYNRPPIQIALLQRHAMDAFHASGEPLLLEQPSPRNLKVACIGGGPASLACAAELRRQGATVTVIDRRALPGGLNTYGVAEYKLPVAHSLREAELIREMGVEFRLNTPVDSSADLATLEAEFDYIFIGVGLGAMQRLNIPGENHPGVLNALALISAYKTGHITQMSGTIVVVGAGNTAIDAAVAARRLGADTVYMLYRRGAADLSAFDFELEHARQEGIQFLWHRLPVSIRTASEDQLENENLADGALLLDTVAVRKVGDSLEELPNSLYTIPCNKIVPAIGQSPLTQLLNEERFVITADGRILINRETGQTTNPRFFAGGDCVNGGREVVDAVADGKRAAFGILAASIAAMHSETEVAHA